MSYSDIIHRCERNDPTLTAIEIDCGITLDEPTNQDLEKICSALHPPSIVTVLDLSHVAIDIHICEAMGRMLQVNEGLQELCLRYCHVGDKGTAFIAQGLHANCTLTKLVFVENQINTNGCRALGQMLGFNERLQTLSLYDNSIDDQGVAFIAQGLHNNSTLAALIVGTSGIGIQGCEEIGQMLCRNKCLQKLKLSYCNIGDKGAHAVCPGLHQNEVIRYLNLGGNNIGDDGCFAIQHMLKFNRSLTRLDLYDNYGIGGQGINRIGNGLQQNHRITRIELSHKNKELVQFHLTLNKVGFGLLLRSDTASVDLLIEALASIRNFENSDRLVLSCYYYSLTKKPELCNLYNNHNHSTL